MYLVSIYFDEATNKKIQSYIDAIAKSTGNTYMLDGGIPPHITISLFEAKKEREEQVIIQLEQCVKELTQGKIQWVSVGIFLPYVIYLTPVLNEYLHEMSSLLYENLVETEDVNISKYYRPFQWLPHTTIGKKMLRKELLKAFETLQNQFVPFSGIVTKIGLSKTNPYRDIVTFILEEEIGNS